MFVHFHVAEHRQNGFRGSVSAREKEKSDEVLVVHRENENKVKGSKK